MAEMFASTPLVYYIRTIIFKGELSWYGAKECQLGSWDGYGKSALRVDKLLRPIKNENGPFSDEHRKCS